MANAPEWSPLAYASNTGAAAFRNSPPRGNDTSVGSSSVSVCTFSGWSRASWAPIDAPVEWPAM